MGSSLGRNRRSLPVATSLPSRQKDRHHGSPPCGFCTLPGAGPASRLRRPSRGHRFRGWRTRRASSGEERRERTAPSPWRPFCRFRRGERRRRALSIARPVVERARLWGEAVRLGREGDTDYAASLRKKRPGIEPIAIELARLTLVFGRKTSRPTDIGQRRKAALEPTSPDQPRYHV